MTEAIDDTAIDQLFLQARTHAKWSDRPVEEEVVRRLYDMVRMAPTSGNGGPGRFVWVRSDSGKQKLADMAFEGNKPKVLAAPLTVIVGYDVDFAEKLPKLFPARGEAMKAMILNSPMAEPNAFRNGSLQGGYLIIAARALGLDVGPMSGFDQAAVDEGFFGGTKIKSNFICTLGYGSGEGMPPRNPRLSFEEAGWFA